MTHIAYRSAAIAFLLMLSTPALPNETLCGSSEEVVFSCSVQRGKTISVCASSTKKDTAIISYRFGSAKNIELELTADTSQDSPSIEHNGTRGARAYDYFVRFKSSDYTYTVQEYWDGCPWPGETRCKKYSDFTGVIVAKSKKVLAHIACTAPGAGINSELLSRLHVPVSEKWPE